MTPFTAVLVLVLSCGVISTAGWLTISTGERKRQSPAIISRLEDSTSPSGLSASNQDDQLEAKDIEAKRLREEARRLRQEVEEFEKKRAAMELAEKKEVQAKMDALVDQYSVVIPILKPDGTTMEEKVQFPPRLDDTKSTIFQCTSPLPLGILLGEHESLEGMTVVNEVLAGSNGAKAGIREGDLLRACTACKVEMVR
jgi:hypothetical protein